MKWPERHNATCIRTLRSLAGGARAHEDVTPVKNNATHSTELGKTNGIQENTNNISVLGSTRESADAICQTESCKLVDLKWIGVKELGNLEERRPVFNLCMALELQHRFTDPRR